MNSLKPLRGRFYLDLCGDGWQVVDSQDATVIGGKSKRECSDIARFAREYVRKHGDVHFNSFPWSLGEPLRLTRCQHGDTVGFCVECSKETA